MATKKTDKSSKDKQDKKNKSKSTPPPKKPSVSASAKAIEKTGKAKTPKQENVAAAPVIKGSLAKPNADQAVRMVMQVMNDFITSKQEKSMQHFFHTIAKKWQDMTTVEKLNTSFANVINDQTSWDFLKPVQPSLIKDGISERGDWVVVGMYPTKPKKLIFDQIFINENNEWKVAELKLFTAD